MKFSAIIWALFLAPTTLCAKGVLSHGVIKSSALGVTKSYIVYLPDGYADSDTRYPVIYQIHGWGVTERKWSSPEMDLQGVADSIELQVIVVMPDGDRGAYVNSITPSNYDACIKEPLPAKNVQEPRQEFCVRTPNYEDYMIKDLIPHIDSAYRTIPTHKARAISGESAGGLASMHLAIRHTELFASAASHSGGVSMLYDGPVQYVPGEGKTLSSIEHRPGIEEWEKMFGFNIERWRQYDPYSLLGSLKKGELAIYLDCGTEDEFGFYEMGQHFQERLQELGLDHTFEWVQGGRHNDALFKSRIPFSLKFHVKQFQQAGVYPDAP